MGEPHGHTRRAELYVASGSDGIPTTWDLRLFNARDEQQMTSC